MSAQTQDNSLAPCNTPTGPTLVALDRLSQMTAEQLLREKAIAAAREMFAAERAELLSLAPVVVVADVDDLPVSLAGTEATLTQEDLEKAMLTRPVTLRDALRMARKEKATPTLLRIGAGDEAVFYRRKSNWISGESGQGKSNVAKLAVYQEALAGRASLFLDREKDIAAFAETMVEFGDLTDEQADLVFYWCPTKSTEELMPTVLGFAAKYGIDLVVLDSCGRDLTRFGPTTSENSNDDVRRWYTACVEPMVRFGLTPLIIDHVRKPGMSASGAQLVDQSTSAKGAIAKREVVTGAAVMLRTAKKFSKTQAGFAKLVAAKDNNGTHTEGVVIAEFHVTPGEERSAFGLRESTDIRDGDGKLVPTMFMEKVSAFIADFDGDPSKSVVVKGVSGNTVSKNVAIDKLVELGFVRVQGGGAGKAMNLVHVQPFVRAVFEAENLVQASAWPEPGYNPAF